MVKVKKEKTVAARARAPLRLLEVRPSRASSSLSPAPEAGLLVHV